MDTTFSFSGVGVCIYFGNMLDLTITVHSFHIERESLRNVNMALLIQRTINAVTVIDGLQSLIRCALICATVICGFRCARPIELGATKTCLWHETGPEK